MSSQQVFLETPSYFKKNYEKIPSADLYPFTKKSESIHLPFNTLICLSHLRWDFVFQRPQHLMSRFAACCTVYYMEEPLFSDETRPRLETRKRLAGLSLLVPIIPKHIPQAQWVKIQGELLEDFIKKNKIRDYGLWYYTPMALDFSKNLKPNTIIYDCMDELSGFRGASPELGLKEKELLLKADTVFTGGMSLYEAKKYQHANIHPFPSSVEVEHFKKSRTLTAEPSDQRNISGPRIGFFGVLDERLDTELVKGIAELRPDWNFIFLGPLAKIEVSDLPNLSNIHYLGPKTYQDLPSYLAGWDVAILPFAHNEATRFISPTKTPEYLAAGCPVVSTSIKDVVNPYQILNLVRIADTKEAFIEAISLSHSQKKNISWLSCVDHYLKSHSWDKTFKRMCSHIQSNESN